MEKPIDCNFSSYSVEAATVSENKIPASVYIITLNEERNIQRALKSVKAFDEVILVDSGSTDSTKEIAQRFTNQVSHQDWLGYAGQKSHALALCSNSWVLNIDADEELTSELEREIRDLIQQDDADGLDIPIVGQFLGIWPHSKANRRIRFFRKERGHYNDVEVHESISVEGKVKIAKGALHHYSFETLAERMEKLNNYSTLKAQEKANRGKRSSLLKLLLVMPLMFFKSLFVRRGILDGRRGFINAMMTSYYAFLKEAKLYEATRDKN